MNTSRERQLRRRPASHSRPGWNWLLVVAIVVVPNAARASDMCGLSVLLFGPVYVAVAALTAACAAFMNRRETLAVAVALAACIGVGTIIQIVLFYLVGDAGEHEGLRNFGLFFIAVIVGVNVLLWIRLKQVLRTPPVDREPSAPSETP